MALIAVGVVGTIEPAGDGVYYMFWLFGGLGVIGA